MWRAYFYDKSWLGKWIYKPLAGIFWIFLISSHVFNYVTEGKPQILGLLIILAGFILFLTAKISVIRKGKLLSFGPTVIKNVSGEMKICYVLGYIFMIIGLIFSFK